MFAFLLLVIGAVVMVLVVGFVWMCWRWFPVWDVRARLNSMAALRFSLVRIEEVSARWGWLRTTPLATRTESLRALGFAWHGDYEIKVELRNPAPPTAGHIPMNVPLETAPIASPFSAPTPGKKPHPAPDVSAPLQLPQYFVRLFLHPEHGCSATVSTFCIQPPDALNSAKVEPLQTTIASMWCDEERGVSYITTDRAPDFFAELAGEEDEDDLWTRRPQASVAELMALHLRRRAELSPRIDLPFFPVLSPDVWIELEEQSNERLHERFSCLAKQPAAVLRQKRAYRRSAQAQPNFEWLGRYSITTSSP